MTDDSRANLPQELREVAPRLTLTAEGTFTVVDLPEFTFRGTAWVFVAQSGRGTWTVRTQGGRDLVELTFETGFASTLDISSSLGSPTKLQTYLGDPDSGRRIEFAKSDIHAGGGAGP